MADWLDWLVNVLAKATVQRKAIEVIVTGNRAPIVMIEGQLIETEIPPPPDMTQLMKSITPQRCQDEFEEAGLTKFCMAFAATGSTGFRVLVFDVNGEMAMQFRTTRDGADSVSESLA